MHIELLIYLFIDLISKDSLFDDQSVEVYESIGNIQPLGHNKKSRDLPPVPPSNSIQELDDFQGSGKIKERSKSQVCFISIPCV